MSEPIRCRKCEQPFSPARVGTAYCSSACRQSAFRARRNANAAAVTPSVRPFDRLAAVDRITALARAVAARNPRRRKLVAFLRRFVERAEALRARLAAASQQSDS